MVANEIATANRTSRGALVARCAVIATTALFALMAARAAAQGREGEACKSEPIGRDKQPDFVTAFVAAEKRAKARAPDAAVARLTHTTLGPIDADARSADWYMIWYSPAADAHVRIAIAKGTITCWGDKGRAGRMPKLQADFYRDVKQLLVVAVEKGGASLLKEGYVARVEMSADAHAEAYWYVNYQHPQQRQGLQVTFDANSGKFLRALR